MDTLKAAAEQEGRPQQLTAEKVQHAFEQAFSGVNGEIVLANLDRFCGDGTFCMDSERHNCYMQGRFSVMIEIRNRLKQKGNGNGGTGT